MGERMGRIRQIPTDFFDSDAHISSKKSKKNPSESAESAPSVLPFVPLFPNTKNLKSNLILS